MDKAQLDKLKEDAGILYMYKIPCSYFEDKFQWIIVGTKKKRIKQTSYYTKEEWFDLLKSGSLLPYVCATLGKAGKIKEFVNIYERPDVLVLRKYLLTSKIPDWRLFQECCWADQIMTEFKVNRPDVFKNVEFTKEIAKNEMVKFLSKIEPMYHSAIANNSK